jgi:hypothetical protein
MAYKDSSGNILNKTEMLALATAGTTQTVYTFNSDVHQTFTYDGSSHFEGGSKLFFAAGQQVPSGVIDALYVTGTATAISPTTGLAAGGTPFAITGTKLTGTEGVTFGGVAATAVVVKSDTRVEGITPAHATGAVTVVIKDDAGDITKPTFFTYS